MALPLSLVAVVTGYLGATGSKQALELLAYKAQLICAAFALAHFLRVLGFPAINYNKASREDKLFIAGLYLVIIWAVAVAG